SPCSAAASFSSPQITPPSAVAVASSGSIATPFISARSIITPPSVTARPATLWPPPRIETSSPVRPARPSAATTSFVGRQRTLIARSHCLLGGAQGDHVDAHPGDDEPTH